MTETIGLAAVSEPPVWTELPGVWTNLRIASALTDAILTNDAEDKPLKYAVFDAERVCRQMRDEMAAQLAAAQSDIQELYELLEEAVTTANEYFARIEQQHEEIRRFQAGNAELRGKMTNLQPELDWSQAPPDAQWWAMDDNGQSYWFVECPTKHEKLGYWGSSAGAILAGETLAPGWESSLRQRPGT